MGKKSLDLTHGYKNKIVTKVVQKSIGGKEVTDPDPKDRPIVLCRFGKRRLFS